MCNRNGGKCGGGCDKGIYWGPDCKSNCPANCKDGKCPQNAGGVCHACNPGFWGEGAAKCANPCQKGCLRNCNFKTGKCGWDCKTDFNANCLGDACYNSGFCVTDCKDGWWGEKCNDNCPKDCLVNQCSK